MATTRATKGPWVTVAAADLKPGDHFLTVQLLGSGWAAVEMWINNEHEDGLGDFPELWKIGFGRYRTRGEAQVEMRQWSVSDEIPILEGN